MDGGISRSPGGIRTRRFSPGAAKSAEGQNPTTVQGGEPLTGVGRATALAGIREKLYNCWKSNMWLHFCIECRPEVIQFSIHHQHKEA